MYLKYFFKKKRGLVMLSQQTIDIVKSTVPVLEEHGTTLLKHFIRICLMHIQNY